MNPDDIKKAKELSDQVKALGKSTAPKKKEKKAEKPKTKDLSFISKLSGFEKKKEKSTEYESKVIMPVRETDKDTPEQIAKKLNSLSGVLNKEVVKDYLTAADVIKKLKTLQGNDRLDISNIRNGENLARLANGGFNMNDQRWHGGGSSSGGGFITAILDTNSIDLVVTGTTLSANLLIQSTSTVNLSIDASGLKADFASLLISQFTNDAGYVTASGVLTLGPIGATPNANAATIAGSTLNLEPASASFGGVITTGVQSFAGVKTFTAATSIAPGAVGTPGLYLSTDTTTGIYRGGVDQFNIAAAGAQVFNLGTSGVIVTGTLKSSGAISPVADDGASIGTTALKYSDAFFASGAVINFNSGNATITHSASLLTSNVDIVVPDEAYGIGWDNSLEVPTKNAIYDKIEAVILAGANTALSNLASVSINTSLLAQTGVDLGSTTKPFRNLFLWGTGTYGTTYAEITSTPTAGNVFTLPDLSGDLMVYAQTFRLTRIIL